MNSLRQHHSAHTLRMFSLLRLLLTTRLCSVNIDLII